MQTAKRLGLKEQIELVIFRTIQECSHDNRIVGNMGDEIIPRVEEILEDESLTPSAKYQKAAYLIDRTLSKSKSMVIELDKYSDNAVKRLTELRDLFNRAHSEAFDHEVYTDKERLFFLLKHIEEERAIRKGLDDSWSRAILFKFAGGDESISSIVERREIHSIRIKKMEKEIVKIFKSYPDDVQEKFAQEFLDMQKQEKLDVN